MAGPRDLIGLSVDVVVSDPWDFATPDGSVRFPARIARAETFAAGADEERLLIELDDPFVWQGNSYRFFAASERSGHGLTEDLIHGRSVDASLVAISNERVSSPDALDVSGWRGGLAARATLEPHS
jgi:hypothetical protein